MPQKYVVSLSENKDVCIPVDKVVGVARMKRKSVHFSDELISSKPKDDISLNTAPPRSSIRPQNSSGGPMFSDSSRREGGQGGADRNTRGPAEDIRIESIMEKARLFESK